MLRLISVFTLLTITSVEAAVPDAYLGSLISVYDQTKQEYLLAAPRVEPAYPRALLIYLHGHGSDRNQGFDQSIFGESFRRLRVECERRGFAYATLDYRGKTSWMNPPAEADVTQLIGNLKKRLRVKEVYLTGASMGGTSALAYAVRHPELLSGVIAICPATDIGKYGVWCSTKDGLLKQLSDAISEIYKATPEENRKLFAGRSVVGNHSKLTMPVVVVHGELDTIIPVDGSRKLAALMRRDGQTLLYQEIKGGGHDTPVIQADWRRYLDFIIYQGERLAPAN